MQRARGCALWMRRETRVSMTAITGPPTWCGAPWVRAAPCPPDCFHDRVLASSSRGRPMQHVGDVSVVLRGLASEKSSRRRSGRI